MDDFGDDIMKKIVAIILVMFVVVTNLTIVYAEEVDNTIIDSLINMDLYNYNEYIDEGFEFSEGETEQFTPSEPSDDAGSGLGN